MNFLSRSRQKQNCIYLAVVASAAFATFAGTLHAQGAGRMTRTATGFFVVEMKPVPGTESDKDDSLGRMSLDKKFEGDLVAVGKGQMLTAMTQTKGSAGYVAIERVEGVLHGKKGSFVFQHSATMNRGAPQQSIVVVPDSGTEELQGISGTFKINMVDKKHSYSFDYSLPQ